MHVSEWKNEKFNEEETIHNPINKQKQIKPVSQKQEFTNMKNKVPQEPSSQKIQSQQLAKEPEKMKLPDIPLEKEGTSEINGPAKYVKEKSPVDSRYERINLPSNHIFYDFDTLCVREFNAEDLSLIYKGVQTGNFSLLIDAVGNTLYDVDVRELTTKDFNFIMYHHRLRDYPTSPWIVSWMSRYGNKNKIEVRQSSLNVSVIQMTKEEYQKKYLPLGITYPRVKDLEVSNDIKDEGELFLLNRAQYLIGDNLEEKMKIIKTANISMLEGIREFSKVTKHGVEETIWLTDKEFDPKKALEYLRKSYAELRPILEHADFDISDLEKKADGYRIEADKIEQALKEGKNILPAREEVGVKIDALKFFPGI